MKKVLLLIFLSLSLHSNDFMDKVHTNIESIENTINEINFRKVIRRTADYFDHLSSQNIIDKINEKFASFYVREAQSVTYEVKVTTRKDIKSSGTAVAIASNGTLITTYHNIARYKKIEVVNDQGKTFPVRVGKVSLDHDLAYLYIDAKNIPYAKVAKDSKLGQDVYILSHDGLLLSGIASQVKRNSVVINVEARKGTSGGGVFNKNNELISILVTKDILDKTSTSVRANMFGKITQEYKEQKSTHKDMKDYDTNYCYNKDDSHVWKEHAKSKDLNMQELHALFIGLCNKVENRDITADQAQFIFESVRHRLLEN